MIPLLIPFPLLNHQAEHLEVEDCLCVRDPILKQQKSVKRKEQHNPHPLVLLGDRRQRISAGSQAQEEGRSGGKVFYDLFLILIISHFIGGKFKLFPKTTSVLTACE